MKVAWCREQYVRQCL